MVAKSATLAKLQTEIVQFAIAGGDLSSHFERGQAESPLTDGFRQISQSTTVTPSLSISLLCFEDSTEAKLRQWFESASQIEIHTASIDELRKQPHAYQRFCTAGHLFIVAAPSSHPMTETEAVLINGIAGNFAVIWPIVVGERSADHDSWWEQAVFTAHGGQLKPFFLQADSIGASGNALADPTCDLRSALLSEQKVTRLQHLVASLADRKQRDLAALQVRQTQCEKQHKPTPARGTSSTNDKSIAHVRERFAEEITLLEKQVNLKSDRAVQPLGKLTNLMRENATRLRIEDLDKEESPLVTKLSVNGSHLATVNRQVEHALRQELTADVGVIGDRLRHLTAQASVNLRDLLGEQVLSVPPLQESSIWRTVENLMAIGKESNIELARKGFFDVLTAGRQKVFILIMFVSLMGRMGLPNLFQTGAMRTGFGLFMLIVLVSSMVNAIVTWRRERESQTEKEMSKIKESLFNDGTKVIEQVEKGKLNFLRDYLKDVNKKFDQQLKRAAEQQITGGKSGADLKSQQRDANRKKLDTRLKQLNDLGRQIDKLTTDARGLKTAASGAIREAVRTHATEPPANEQSPSATKSKPTLEVNKAVAAQPAEPAEAAAVSPQPKAVEPSPSPVTASPRRVSALAQRREARRKAREATSSAQRPDIAASSEAIA